MATEVYVAGVGMTKFGKSKMSLPQLMVEAASRALADARVPAIDYVYIGVMSVEEFTGESNIAALIADRLGLPGSLPAGWRLLLPRVRQFSNPPFMPWHLDTTGMC